MAKTVKEYYHNIDLKKNLLLNSRLHNLNTSERIILGGSLTINDQGYQVYDTNYKAPYWWNGSYWLTSGGTVEWGTISGDLINQGDLITYLDETYYSITNPEGYVSGNGTQNKIVKWSVDNSLIDSNITDDGTTVSIDSSITNITGLTELLFSTDLLYVKSNKDLLILVPTSQINLDFELSQNFRIGFGGDGTKYRNTVLGRFVLGGYSATDPGTNTGDSNTAIGYQVLAVNTSGFGNAGFGAQSLRLNTTGVSNLGFGTQSLYSNTSGSWNVGVGNQAMFFNETGNYNVARGFMAGFNDVPIGGWRNTSNNIFIGYNCGGSGGDGSIGYNTFIGSSTGLGIVNGNYNTIIGAQVSGLSSSLSNNVIIADGQGNIRIRIKDTGNVLIGTNTDTGYKLDVNGNLRIRQVNEYASNAAAITAGLLTGAFYRTGEILKVVY